MIELNPEEAQRRLRRAFELHEVAKKLALAGLKADHPDATEADLYRLLREKLDRGRRGKWGIDV